jgi:queuine tRNA-ribosyltransferase
MFDCVLPTRVARRGALYLRSGRTDITAGRFRDRDEPVDPDCDCYTCRTFSAAYLHHLFRAEELLAYRLATIHNVRFMHRQMEQMRAAIDSGTFDGERASFLSEYQPANQAIAAEQRAKFRSRQAAS